MASILAIFKNSAEHKPICASWFVEAAKQIEAIAALPPGWDSHGAGAPDPKLLSATTSLLEGICRGGARPKPRIHPARSGGVHLEWECGPRYLEVEVASENSATYFFQDSSAGVEEEGEIREGDSLEPLLEYIERVDASAE